MKMNIYINIAYVCRRQHIHMKNSYTRKHISILYTYGVCEQRICCCPNEICTLIHTNKHSYIHMFLHTSTHTRYEEKTRSRDSLSDTRWTHEHNVLIIKFAHILYPHEMKRITKILTQTHTRTQTCTHTDMVYYILKHLSYIYIHAQRNISSNIYKPRSIH